MSSVASVKSADIAVKSDEGKVINEPIAADNTETVEPATEDGAHQHGINDTAADNVGLWFLSCN